MYTTTIFLIRRAAAGRLRLLEYVLEYVHVYHATILEYSEYCNIAIHVSVLDTPVIFRLVGSLPVHTKHDKEAPSLFNIRVIVHHK